MLDYNSLVWCVFVLCGNWHFLDDPNDFSAFELDSQNVLAVFRNGEVGGKPAISPPKLHEVAITSLEDGSHRDGEVFWHKPCGSPSRSSDKWQRFRRYASRVIRSANRLAIQITAIRP